MTAKCSGCRDGTVLPFAIRTAFQPVIDLKSGKPYAYEALVRGANGEGAASVLAQVTPENRYAFDQACRVAAIREAIGAGILDTGASLSINFLPNAVYSPMACIQLTLQTARETGLPLDRIIIELTENEQIQPDHLSGIIDAYREIGFRTAIDDFGAGHSGLALLANLQTDIIKLDRELVRDIDTSLSRRIIVAGLLRLADELGLKVVAEGVETGAELNALTAAGVRYVQGYLFARPALGQLPPLSHTVATALAA